MLLVDVDCRIFTAHRVRSDSGCFPDYDLPRDAQAGLGIHHSVIRKPIANP
jgi:hypothetical protein